MNANAPKPPPPEPPDGSEELPPEIGGYQIQRILGTGGMATVYAALQSRPRRTVALKVMRGATDARTAMRRFRREVEILGKLRHPYIAQIFDAGVHVHHGGTVPYFVMEYVPRAKTITAFATENDLSLRHRLKIFVKVCAAVEHGHRRKIVHRDLKPGNILIDETGDPKVIDFGVARALEVDPSAQTIQTEEGRLVGTVQYMAPEQLDATRQDLDARCDVYALGGVLYRLLTGRAPHDLTGLPVFTAAQIIREDAPPRPGSISPELKGDLETIILRSLAKDRSRRYPSAGSLGRDIMRYLAHKPIKARKVGFLHRLRLFLRRHPTETRAAVIVSLVMIGAGTIIVSQQMALRRRTAQAPESHRPATVGDPARASRSADLDPPPDPGAAAPGAATASAVVPEPFVLARSSDAVTAMAFDPATQMLAVATARPAVSLWDLETREAIFTTTDHAVAATRMAFSANGAILASMTTDGEVVLIERRDRTTKVRLRRRFPVATRAMALSPTADRVAVACDDLTLRVVRTEPHADPLLLRATRGSFISIAFSPDGSLIAAGTDGGGVLLWSVADGRTVRRFPPFDAAVCGIGFGPGGAQLIAFTTQGTGRAWPLDTTGDEPGAALVTRVEPISSVAFAADGTSVACASSQTIDVLALPDGHSIITPPAQDADTSLGPVAVSHDARWYALARSDGTVFVAPIAARW